MRDARQTARCVIENARLYAMLQLNVAIHARVATLDPFGTRSANQSAGKSGAIESRKNKQWSPTSSGMLAIIVSLLGLLCFDSPVLASGQKDDSSALDGLWSGFWGLLIEPNGTVHQPVTAQLFIQGEHVEWTGFPDVSELTGTIRIDAGAKRIQVTPAAGAGRRPANTIVFKYEINADRLTLTDREQRPIVFNQVRSNPLANVKMEFLAAVGMNDAGDVLVTDFEVHRAGRSRDIAPALARRPLGTKHAAMFLAQEVGLKKVDIDEVRRLIRDPTSVVVAYRPDDRPLLPPRAQWQETDSDAVARTASRVLRPGTLVFVVPESARVAPPP
jgi:hypothetical protein